MKVGFYQFVPEFGNVEKNIKTMVNAVKAADSDLIVFPELAISGYLFLEQSEVADTASTVPGPMSDAFSKVAVEKNTAVVVGFPEKADGVYYNSALIATPDGKVQVYRKNHLYNEEKLFFKPGNLGFPTFDVKGVKIGVLICFDHMFPESARTLALEGVQIVCHAANLVLPGFAQITSCSRALENGVFWILANRHGTENRKGRSLSYSGLSRIVDNRGKVLASAGADDTGFYGVEIDPAKALDKKVAPMADLFADRRPELYNEITK
ncbi:MAG: acyltransferase [Spirochaetia bacterium]|nr:acyltransferase [Spirochaetia bacterium]MBR5016097.1 acyltransferase [Spirochaetia bacterium]